MTSVSQTNPIAYFCAEYGLDANKPWYAGGLGVLAGDTLKAAADAKIPFVGIGLLYRGTDAKQVITQNAEQVEQQIPVDPLTLGLEPVTLDDQPLFIKVHLTSLDVWLQCWKLQIGETVTLYLLDSETEHNHFNERTLTHSLYSGTEDWQFKQQLLLGIGGVKLLHALGIHPSVYHVNEGRPAFLHWQLIRSYMDHHGMTYDQAREEAKSKTVYTNHTLVGAGNPGYPISIAQTYGAYYADKMGISLDRLLADGKEEGDEDHFHVTRFALNISCKANGVSKMHTKLSAQQWPEYSWTPITNGVHMPTWQDERIREVVNSLSDNKSWQSDLWQVHTQAKHALAEFVQQRTGYTYNPEALVLGWARRVTGYKQLDLLFADLPRLKAILFNQDRPVQLLVSGKAHFGDTASKAVIHDVIKKFSNELSGGALYIPDYNVEVARYLVRGCDVWLNTPQYGMEASGTSGMKAISNGVLSCSVADGWVPEVDWSNKGWILDHTRLSESLYETLENQIIPEYYTRDESGLPQEWLRKMMHSITDAPAFSAQRMMQQYQDDLYAAAVKKT
jgi:alpha-glucan phosphorylase-like protein